jgi:hypothetical protein
MRAGDNVPTTSYKNHPRIGNTILPEGKYIMESPGATCLRLNPHIFVITLYILRKMMMKEDLHCWANKGGAETENESLFHIFLGVYKNIVLGKN